MIIQLSEKYYIYDLMSPEVKRLRDLDILILPVSLDLQKKILMKIYADKMIRVKL